MKCARTLLLNATSHVGRRVVTMVCVVGGVNVDPHLVKACGFQVKPTKSNLPRAIFLSEDTRLAALMLNRPADKDRSHQSTFSRAHFLIA